MQIASTCFLFSNISFYSSSLFILTLFGIKFRYFRLVALIYFLTLCHILFDF